jgi:hypothetical protein
MERAGSEEMGGSRTNGGRNGWEQGSEEKENE